MARRAVLYLAVFPASFFLFAAYTEAPFLLAAVLSLRAARRRSWVWAGFWGGAAALTRLTGALMLVPLAYAAWAAWRDDGDRRGWVAVGITLLAVLIFPLYVWTAYRLPPWTPWLAQTARFQGWIALPGANLVEAGRRLAAGEGFLSDLLDLGFILVFLACAWPVWKRLRPIYAWYYLPLLGLYLVRISDMQPLLGTARYVLALFPAFMVLAEWGGRRRVHRAIVYASWAGLLFMSGQFALWGWVG